MKTENKYRVALAVVLATLAVFTLVSVDVMQTLMDALQDKQEVKEKMIKAAYNKR